MYRLANVEYPTSECCSHPPVTNTPVILSRATRVHASRLAMCVLVLIVHVSAVGTSWALWSSSPDSSLVVAATTGEQRSQVAASDGADGAIIAWEDTRTSPSDLYAQRITAAGVAAWQSNGAVVCSAAGAQGASVILADGAGGAFIAWADQRSGLGGDVYLQRITGAGTPAPGWPTNGLAVCTALNTQSVTDIVSDGQGGVILVWYDQRSGDNDIYAQRVTATGTVPTGWPANGMVVCTGVAQQVPSRMVSDGAGGAYITWADNRTGNPDIYLERITGSGAVASGWPANGLVVCDAANQQRSPNLAADGSGGVFVAWEDLRTDTQGDLYGTHVLGTGAVQIGWAANGNAIAAATEYQGDVHLLVDGTGGVFLVWADARSYSVTGSIDVYGTRLNTLGGTQSGWTYGGTVLRTASYIASTLRLVSDGSDGFIVVWDDIRNISASDDVYALRVSAGGLVAPGWTRNGAQVCSAPDFQGWTAVVPSGHGGALIVWKDQRTDTSDLYAQRLSGYGRLGPDPFLISVADVINDQGGNVVVEWGASYLEAEAGVTSYSVWRRVPGLMQPLIATAIRSPLRRADQPSGVDALYWEYVGSVPARRFPGYSYVAPTTSDSLPGSNPLTSFMILAESASGSWWASNPDSGYSVDNLSPSTPSPFTGHYTEGVTALQWGANRDADFQAYRLYRGAGPDFALSAAALVATLTATSYSDAAGSPYYYKLCAVDVHGNVSPAAVLNPSGTADVPSRELVAPCWLVSPSPSPTAGPCDLAFGLRDPSLATLVIYDSMGRRVRAVAVDQFPAGPHVVRWNGLDDSGHQVSNGLYFVRLDVRGENLVRKITVLR